MAESSHNRLKNPLIYITLLFFINLLYFVDRGIVPGSSNEFNEFISKTFNDNSPDAFLGMLQSAFIIGLLLSSLICGRLVHYYNAFTLVKFGGCIWIVAIIISASSMYANSFLLLVVGRMLSGVGEGSFQCTIPPWIEENVPLVSKSRYLSVFYTAIPVGTAIGYAYSSIVSDELGWPFAFWLEALFMFPLLCCLHWVTRPPVSPIRSPSSSRFESDSSTDSALGGVDKEAFSPVDAEDADAVYHVPPIATDHEVDYDFCADEETSPPTPPTMSSELAEVVSRPVFLCVALGYAAQVATMNGLATFGSSLMMGLGFFDSEEQSSTAFGVVVSAAGLLGTPLGGLLLDRQTHISQLRSESRSTALRSATALIMVQNLVALFFLLLTGFMPNRVAFLVFAGLGSTFIFGSTTGIAIAALESVPPSTRSFAMAVLTVFIHLLGDVPSPVLSGLLKDRLSPSCAGAGAATSAACRSQSRGLRVTIVVVVLWIGWAVLFFGLAWRLSVRRGKRTAALQVNVDASAMIKEPLLTSRVVV